MSKATDVLSTPKAAQHSFDSNSNGFTTPTKRNTEQPQQQQQQPHQTEQFDGAYTATAHSLAVASGQYPGDSQAPVQAYAKLEGPDFCYYVRTLE
ncbi:hypothetical protein EV175_006439, partial [Coemansia sp. RSA 1933]